MNATLPQHTIKTATVFPSLLPISMSVPEIMSIFGHAEPTQQEAQLQQPMVYHYIAAARTSEEPIDQSDAASAKDGEDRRSSVSSVDIDTKPVSHVSSRFLIE